MESFKRSKTILNFLSSRETGFQTIVENPLESPRSSKLRITNFFLTSTPQLNVANCHFVRNGLKNNTVLGVWQGLQFPGVTCEIELKLRPNCSKEECPSLVTNVCKVGPQCTIRPVVDACLYKMQHSSRNSIAYIMPHHEEDKSVIVFTWCGNGTDMDIEYLINTEVYSCAYNSNKDRFIAGTYAMLYTFDSLQFITCRTIPGKPSSLEFNKSGDIIYIADCNTGLHTHDMRTSIICDSIVLPGSVTEFKLLSDETKVVLSSSNSLKMVDLRMCKPIFDYDGPSHIVKKIPLSVAESVDMLCSTNANNITKLWCLSTGKLLYTIMPYYLNATARCCLVSNENQWGVALFQKNWMYILEP